MLDKTIKKFLDILKFAIFKARFLLVKSSILVEFTVKL